MFEPRHESSDRPGPCLDPEILGALVEGGLDVEERRAAREHLSHCPDCAATFSEVLQINEEMAAISATGLENTREPAAMPAPSAPESQGWTPVTIEGGAANELPPPEARSRTKRRGWATAAALAAGLAAAAIAWFVVVPMTSDFESGRIINRWASAGFEGVGEIVSPTSLFLVFRSPGAGGIPDGADAVQVAALFTHLEYLIAREEVELARETATELDSRLDSSRLQATLGSMAESLEAGELPTAEDVAEASSALDETLLFSPNGELGRWAEIVRIAAVSQKDVGVLRSRGLRRTLDRLVLESQSELGFDEIPPSTIEPLAQLQKLLADGVSEEELPEIQEQVEELLRL